MVLGYNCLELTLGGLGMGAVDRELYGGGGWLEVRVTAHLADARGRSETWCMAGEAICSPDGRTGVIATASGPTAS